MSQRQPEFIAPIKKRLFPENNCRRFHFDVIAQATIAEQFYFFAQNDEAEICEIHVELVKDATANKWKKNRFAINMSGRGRTTHR